MFANSFSKIVMNSSYCLRGLLAVFCLAILFSCTEELEVEIPSLGKLHGYVNTSESKPIENASVTVLSSSFTRTVLTNNFGRYTMEDIPKGNYEVKVSKNNYIDISEMVSVSAGIISEKDFSLSIGEPILVLSDTLIMASTIKSEVQLGINSNTSWTAKSMAPWIKLNKEEGTGDNVIKVIWENNTSDNAREGIIIISAGSVTKAVKVAQTVPLKIIKIKGIAGESISKTKSAIELLFNGQVTISKITPISGFCIGELSAPTYNVAKDGLTFTYACGSLGGKYPFFIEYKDQFNNTYTENIEVEFYDKMLEIRGMVVSRFNSPNEDVQWLLTKSPARIYKMDLHTFAILDEFAIEERFSRSPYITINPFNNLLYISNGVSIDIIDPNTGKLVSNIALPAVPYREYENFYVVEMAFNKKGMGLIKSYQTGSSGSTWFVINTAEGNTIAYHHQYGWEDEQYNKISSIKTSHDQKTIYMYGERGLKRGILQSDESVNNLNMIVESYVALFNRISYSNNDERKLIIGDEVIVIDGDQFYELGRIGHYIFTSDFYYNSEQKPYLFFAETEERRFNIMDYKKKDKLKEYMLGAGWSQITSTRDGKYLFVETNNYGYNRDTDTFFTKLFHFSTARFY